MSAYDEGYKVKHPSASELFDFDFADMLGTRTIVGSPAPTVAQTSKANKVAASGNLTIGGATTSGTIVQARISVGTDGEDYRVQATCTDSVGDTIIIDMVLQVRTLGFER